MSESCGVLELDFPGSGMALEKTGRTWYSAIREKDRAQARLWIVAQGLLCRQPSKATEPALPMGRENILNSG